MIIPDPVAAASVVPKNVVTLYLTDIPTIDGKTSDATFIDVFE